MNKNTTVLRTERLRRGFDQARFGFIVNIQPQNISAIERQVMKVGKLRGARICSVLGLDFSAVFRDDGIARTIDETV